LGVRLSHHQLSCMVACTRESVSKAIGGFREAGLIETPRPRSVVVVDGPHLSEVAMGRATKASYGPRGGPKFSGTRILASL
jgi:Crp-like helix-turn-helix domain